MINITGPTFQKENNDSSFFATFNGTGDSLPSLSNKSTPDDDDVSDTTITNLQKNLALYGYIFLFLFGFFGHINSIIIFLQQTLRAVSTSCLFICITASNIIFLLICIYDFLYVGIGVSFFTSQINSSLSNALCRFRAFIQSTAMCSSAWLLLAISIDRWLRIRFPFQVQKLCIRQRVLFGALIILICADAFSSHLLSSSLGSLLGSTTCGPITSSTYSFFFRQVCHTSCIGWQRMK